MYQVHSRVKHPKKRRRSKPEGAGQWDRKKIDLCSSSDSENEGEKMCPAVFNLSLLVSTSSQVNPLKREKSPNLNILRGHRPPRTSGPPAFVSWWVARSAFREGPSLLSLRKEPSWDGESSEEGDKDRMRTLWNLMEPLRAVTLLFLWRVIVCRIFPMC